jgi:hypothetical protein
MRSGLKTRIRQVLLWTLALELAGPGCARFRKRPEPEASPVSSPKLARAWQAPTAERGAEKPGNGRAPLIPPQEDRLKLDTTKVLTLQMQALGAQNQGETECALRRRTGFTCGLDEYHERLYRLMDDTVRWVDTRWLSKDMPYDYELSTFKLSLKTRVGGRGNEGDFDFDVRFRADAELPGLEKKLHLFVDNAGRHALPGSDPLRQEDDTRLGVRAMWRTLRNSQLDLSTGLRFRSSMPVVFADLSWEWRRDLGRWQVRLNPSAYWYSDDGLGQTTELTWTRPIGDRKVFQIRTAENSGEDMDGVGFEQTLKFIWFRSGRKRGWVAQASVFPQLVSSEWVWDNALVNVAWRDALYRKWIYYTIAPQVDFPQEDDYEARPSLRVGLEILFGGEIAEVN